MFIPLDESPNVGLRPAHSAIRPGDWDVLAGFWHPVAIAADIGDEPVAARLLDVELVIYRGEDGTIAVAVDLCPHRHVRLSGGKMIDGQIECPFHGLRFDATGQCQHVPALGRKAKLPPSYRVKTFPVEQRYGLVWTCLNGESTVPIPHLPAMIDVAPEDLTYGLPSLWPISAPRQIENFIDLAHLPLVHAATLGGDPTRALKPGRVEHTNDAVILHASYTETAHDGSPRPASYIYRVVLPFTIDFNVVFPEEPDHQLVSANLVSPTSAHECNVFQLHVVDGSQEMRDGLIKALDVVNHEDISMLAGLAIADLPLDQKHEIHLPVDNICGAYRGRLRDFGLGRARAAATPQTEGLVQA